MLKTSFISFSTSSILKGDMIKKINLKLIVKMMIKIKQKIYLPLLHFQKSPLKRIILSLMLKKAFNFLYNVFI